MAVTETLRALGSWSLNIRGDIPDELWKKIDYYGHVVVHVGERVNPVVAGDSLLKTSRYTGVLTDISERLEQRTLGGAGMALWLGDADDKGDIIETLLEFTSATLEDVATALLPASGAVTEGTFFNTGKTFTGGIQFMSPRAAIDYVMQTKDAAWRVNGDATLDIGDEEDLFIVNPVMVVVRKYVGKGVGSYDDMFLRSLSGIPETARDVQDLTTRVLLMAQGSNGQFASATADAAPGTHPWLDLHGNPIKFTRIVQESETDSGNAEARAQLQLNRFLGTRDALTLNSSNYDIKGEAQVGDYLWVFDPTMELVDINNEVIFRGERINPMKLRLTETTWPVVRGMSVCYRSYTGEWIDLTDWFMPETGNTSLVVGGYNRSLSEGGSGAFPVTPPEVNTTIPDVVEWVTSEFVTGTYQSPTSHETKAQVQLVWLQPDNTDASTITDGAYYEIRYRTATTPFWPVTHQQMEAFTHEELYTFEEPIGYPATDWQYAVAPWDSLTFVLNELTPSMPYEAQIRAVDNGRPANIGAWSVLAEFQAARDTIPPATPAAPEVAASMINCQITHRLGRSSGGTFNLEPDLAHLEVHGGSEPLFTPSEETLLGKLIANWGMITGQIPVVGSFQINSLFAVYFKVVAVDEAGNKSLASVAVPATAELIDDQHIVNLTVSKLTAGTLTADVINAASIKTGNTGARAELNYRGLELYNDSNFNTVNLKSSDGTMDILGAGSVNVRGSGSVRVLGGGNVEITDGALIVYNAAGVKIIELGECADGRHGLQIYKDNGDRVGRLGELSSSADEGIEVIADDGRLVRVSTLAFETKALYDGAFISVTSTAYAGSSPGVTAPIGNSGRAIVSISAGLFAVGPGNNADMGVRLEGPSGQIVEANAQTRMFVGSPNNQVTTRVFLVTGLAVGNWEFLSRYRSSAAGVQASFYERQIVVQPF